MLATDFLSSLGAPPPPGGESSSEEEGEAGPAPGPAALSKRAAKKARRAEAEAAAAVAEAPIVSGIGHKLLLAQGWEGVGHGLRDDGIAEPVRAPR